MSKQISWKIFFDFWKVVAQGQERILQILTLNRLQQAVIRKWGKFHCEIMVLTEIFEFSIHKNNEKKKS